MHSRYKKNDKIFSIFAQESKIKGEREQQEKDQNKREQ